MDMPLPNIEKLPQGTFLRVSREDALNLAEKLLHAVNKEFYGSITLSVVNLSGNPKVENLYVMVYPDKE